MADATHRFHQSATGQYYFPQHNQQNHHYQQRHITRNGSPVNNSRSHYTNDTPSPSRSPVSQTSSHNPFSMYNQGHQQGQHVTMNGGHHQRFMPSALNHKFSHQHYQQHHAQQNHQHQQNHTSNHDMGHQHTFSSGTLSNVTPHQFGSNLHNSNANNHQIPSDNFVPNAHWQRQLQLASESRQARSAPNHHCRKTGLVTLLQNTVEEAPAEEFVEDGKEERNRASNISEPSRQDWDALDCSGQGMRAISPSLFGYQFLTKLYLDHNRLLRLDPCIGVLRKLTHLDISGNQIMDLPEEIGMLVNLKDLLVFDNNLQTLPDEIGHLYKLETLGIDGNPLSDEMREHIMQHGTKSLMTHIRESIKPGPPPNERLRVQIDASPASEILSVASYNILCDKYATISQYGYAPSESLSWQYRRDIILDELRHLDADIFCLQEVDREGFDECFRPELAVNGYRGIFWPKSRARTMTEKEAKLVDGCATFYKTSKYVCLDKILIDFANTAINRQDMKGEHDTFNRVMPRDHIAIATFLENRITGSRLIVANAHIFWDPAYADVKLVQVAILLEQLAKQAEKWAKHPPCTDKTAFRYSEVDSESNADSVDEPVMEPGPSLTYTSGPDIPLIICGDFNSAAKSGVYELITNGSIPGDHPDLENRGYGKFTREGMAHPFKLASAYTGTDELAFTNYTPAFCGITDYIWYSHNSLQIRELLGDVDEEYTRKVPGFPHYHFPSDHLALMAELSLLPRR